MTKHNTCTPLPWATHPQIKSIVGHVDNDKDFIGFIEFPIWMNIEEKMKNAELIIRCVNTHQDLIRLVEKLSEEIEEKIGWAECKLFHEDVEQILKQAKGVV